MEELLRREPQECRDTASLYNVTYFLELTKERQLPVGGASQTAIAVAFVNLVRTLVQHSEPLDKATIATEWALHLARKKKEQAQAEAEYKAWKKQEGLL